LGDDNSGVNFVRIYMTLDDFAKAITGAASMPCEITVRALDKVGKYRLSKKVFIPVVPDYSQRDDREFLKGLVSSYETDGWIASLSDFNNRQNISKEGCTIRFLKYVEEPPGEDEIYW
jgi:hypothetical protein